MNYTINIPNSYENKSELVEFVDKLVGLKLLDRTLNKSKVISISTKLKKRGHESEFMIQLKYGQKEFNVIKKDKLPKQAISQAINNIKRICLEQGAIKPKSKFNKHKSDLMPLSPPSAADQLSA